MAMQICQIPIFGNDNQGVVVAMAWTVNGPFITFESVFKIKG
jgi:hypothetical protein